VSPHPEDQLLKIASVIVLCLVCPLSVAHAQSTLVLDSATTVRDTTIRGGAYAAVNLDGGTLATKISSNADYIRRTLLKFDTESTLPAGIPIQSATLTLTVRSGGTEPTRAIAVYPLTRSFTASEATWNVAKSTTPWSTPGGDLGARTTTAYVTNAAGGKATFDVTALVQSAVSSSGSRWSRLALLDAGAVETGQGGSREYYSLEASDPAVRPRLTIVYGTTSPLPVFSHVVTIIFENHEYESIIGSPSAPYFNSLVQSYGLGTNYYGIMHPSLPNYMALTGGRTVFTTDCVGCTTTAPSIVDQIEQAGRSWRGYMESMASPCLPTDSGLYAQKHNPFVHYAGLLNNRSRCESHVVSTANLLTHLQNGDLANYTWITPNLCNDMHDCSITTGDRWLAGLVPKILASPAWDRNSVLFIVFDEGTTASGGGGRIPFIAVSARTTAGLKVAAPYNHYNLLATIEQSWGMPRLGHAAGAAVMSDFFR
jgi:phosphatidylinositol-3-phosphatase